MNKEICIKCQKEHVGTPKTLVDEERLKSINKINFVKDDEVFLCCLIWQGEHWTQWVKLNEPPPEKCFYTLEHLVNE